MPVVKLDVKTVKVGLAACRNISHELLRCNAHFFGGNHDGRPVRVVSPNEIDSDRGAVAVDLHALKAYPYVSLDVFHDVTNMEFAVGIRQGGGNKQAALGHKLVFCCFKANP